VITERDLADHVLSGLKTHIREKLFFAGEGKARRLLVLKYQPSLAKSFGLGEPKQRSQGGAYI
jgi:hypothetical protein